MKQQRTVLIVDSSPENRYAYQRFLLQQSEFDYRILEAASGEEGLATCQKASIDGILLNFTLPDLDGLQFLAQLANQITEILPSVVVVAQEGDESFSAKVIQAGAQDCLMHNSITPQAVRRAMRNALSIGELQRQLHQSQLALEHSEERLRLALQAASMGAWEWNLITGEVSWSPNCAPLFGVDAEAFPQTLEAWSSRIHPVDLPRVYQVLQETLRTGKQLNNEYRIIRPDGEVRWLFCNGQMERNAAGQPIRMLGITQDITERKRSELERAQLLKLEQAAREEAETANNSKDEFLAIVTHELRTPLNAILGWAKLMRTRNLNPLSSDPSEVHFMNRALETIERNAQTQSQLIEDLLDVSRIIRGQLRLKVMPVKLRAVVFAAIEAVKLSADAKQIKLNFTEVDPELTVAGDPERLQQIVLNLLTNAIKFTPETGQINVQLTTDTTDTHASVARITIRDTGIGIDQDFLPFVFDRFRQADDSNPRTEDGLGLGLAIVHQLVELHKGTVQVESDGQGQGATFIVMLPLN